MGPRLGMVWGLELNNRTAGTPSNLKGYPGVDESFSAETLRLEVLLLQIEKPTQGMVLTLEKVTSKIDLFKLIVICGNRQLHI